MDVFGRFAFTLALSFLAGLVIYFVTRFIITRQDDSIRRLIDSRQTLGMSWTRTADKLFLLFTLLVASILIIDAIARYRGFWNGGLDVAGYSQAIWNSLNGRLFEATPIGNRASLLGTHFALLLLGLVPVYALKSDLAVIGAVQVVAVVGMIFPLYWFAKPRVGHMLALVIAIAFLLSPVLPAINTYGFHDILLSTVPLALALYFLINKKDLAFIVSAFVALLAREDVSLFVMSFGLYILLIQRRLLFGASVITAGLIWVIVVTQFIMPTFNPSGMWLGSFYPGFGGSITEIGTSIVTRPGFFLQNILTPQKIAFSLHLLVPLAFVSLIGFEVTVMIIIYLLALLLSAQITMTDFFNYYPVSLLPFIFFGCVIGLQRVMSWRMSSLPTETATEFSMLPRKLAMAAIIIVSSLVTFCFYSLPVYATMPERVAELAKPHIALGYALLQQIPGDAVLATQDELIAQSSNRQRVYGFPSFPDYRQVDYLFADTTRFWYGFHRDVWADIFALEYFQIVAQQDGYILARRRPLEHLSQVQFGDQLSFLGYTIVPAGTIGGGQTIRPIVAWRADEIMTERYEIQVHLLDRQGHLWAKDDREPQDGRMPTDTWSIGKTVGDQYVLTLPITMPPGDYHIAVSVFDPRNQRYLASPGFGTQATFATVPIEKNKSNVSASDLVNRFQLEVPFFSDMGEMRLIGLTPIPETTQGRQVLPVGLYWRARAKPRGDYLVKVELIDSQGHVALVEQSRPAAGAYPTTQWDEGEVLLDWHDLELSALKPGRYTVQVILTDPSRASILGETELPSVLTVVP